MATMDAEQFDALRGTSQDVLSRRAALGRLGGSGAAALLATLGLRQQAAVGQQGTPAALPQLVEEWAASQTAHDPDRFVALCTDDVTHEEVVAGFVPISGKAGLKMYLEGLFASFPDVTVTPETGFVADTWGAVQWTFAGTRTGPTSPVGETETSYSLRGASVWELEGGKIRRSTGYYDLLTILVQLGAISPPGDAGTPVPATPAP
jgi:steroid delta-isomerase-like uncharacterized protein